MPKDLESSLSLAAVLAAMDQAAQETQERVGGIIAEALGDIDHLSEEFSLDFERFFGSMSETSD